MRYKLVYFSDSSRILFGYSRASDFYNFIKRFDEMTYNFETVKSKEAFYADVKNRYVPYTQILRSE